MKTFEIYENIDYNGDDSEKVSLGYIKAKNIDTASKRALKEYLTKEQRKDKIVSISDSDINSYTFETKFFDENGNKLEDYEQFDEDNMSFESHELVIELIPDIDNNNQVSTE